MDPTGLVLLIVDFHLRDLTVELLGGCPICIVQSHKPLAFVFGTVPYPPPLRVAFFFTHGHKGSFGDALALVERKYEDVVRFLASARVYLCFRLVFVMSSPAIPPRFHKGSFFHRALSRCSSEQPLDSPPGRLALPSLVVFKPQPPV